MQRVPATEQQGRVHTSAVTVAVLPEAEDVDIKIEAKDLRIDTFCSSGPGGQSVNTTYSAVRITHIPTNTVVSCQDEKSQIKNREKGMRVLRSRLYEVEMQKQQDALAKERKAMVGSGDRSEKIRTYNFPQNRVTDHRIGLTIHQLEQVMDGKLQPLIDALVTHYQVGKAEGGSYQRRLSAPPRPRNRQPGEHNLHLKPSLSRALAPCLHEQCLQKLCLHKEDSVHFLRWPDLAWPLPEPPGSVRAIVPPKRSRETGTRRWTNPASRHPTQYSPLSGLRFTP